jgi:hypothetical protein
MKKFDFLLIIPAPCSACKMQRPKVEAEDEREGGGVEVEEEEEEEERQRRRQVARARWGILRNALLSSRSRTNAAGGRTAAEGDGGGGATSKRAFPGFELFTKACAQVPNVEQGGQEVDFTLVRYTSVLSPACSAVVQHPSRGAALAKADLAGFDNTGNICTSTPHGSHMMRMMCTMIAHLTLSSRLVARACVCRRVALGGSAGPLLP